MVNVPRVINGRNFAAEAGGESGFAIGVLTVRKTAVQAEWFGSRITIEGHPGHAQFGELPGFQRGFDRA